MLQMINLGSDKVIGMHVESKLTPAEFEKVAAAMEEKLERHQKLRIYAEVSFGGMSVETFFKDMQYSLNHWNRFEREAIVTGQAWLEATTEVVDKIFPGIEVRAFPISGAETARRWILQE